MDNTLNLKLEDLQKAIETLNEALKQEKNDFLRDAVIKRFEYCFELCWKTIKVFLYQNFGVDSFSPKECFRELKKNNIIDEKKTEILLQMADDRNKIIHTYNKKYSNELYQKISRSYFDLLNEVYKSLENNKDK
ncbi:nucleotidyltransferase substrate binding protein [bacterium]|nr:nucleotidyltransferase substrate binding protein [bacterium]